VQHPSLPHQAGKALARFWEAAAAWGLARVRRAHESPLPRKRVRQADRRLVVRPLVRSELDAHQLARAVMGLAYDRAKNKRQRSDEEQAA
jgi:hypothetical protein